MVVGAGGVGLSTMMGAQLAGRDHDRRGRPVVEGRLHEGAASSGSPPTASTRRRPMRWLRGPRAHRRPRRRLRLRRRGGHRHPRPRDRRDPSGRDLRGHRAFDGRGRSEPRHHARCCASVCSPAPTAGRSIPAATSPSSSSCTARVASTSARSSTRRYTLDEARRRSTTCTTGASRAASCHGRDRESGSIRMTSSISFDEIESREGFFETRREARRRSNGCPSPPRQERHVTLISVDDHLVEPPHLFEGRVPAKFADRAPRVETDDDGHGVLALRRQAALQGRAQRGGRQAAGAALVRARPASTRCAAARRTSTPACTTWTSTACTRR